MTHYAHPASIRELIQSLWQPEHSALRGGLGMHPDAPHTWGLRGFLADALEENDLPGHIAVRSPGTPLTLHEGLPVPGLPDEQHLRGLRTDWFRRFEALFPHDRTIGIHLLPGVRQENGQYHDAHEYYNLMAPNPVHDLMGPYHAFAHHFADWMHERLTERGLPTGDDAPPGYHEVLNRIRSSDPYAIDNDWVSRGDYAAYQDDDATQYSTPPRLPHEVADLLWQFWNPDNLAQATGWTPHPYADLRGMLADALDEHGFKGGPTLRDWERMVVPMGGEGRFADRNWEPTYVDLPVPGRHSVAPLWNALDSFNGVIGNGSTGPDQHVWSGQLDPWQYDPRRVTFSVHGNREDPENGFFHGQVFSHLNQPRHDLGPQLASALGEFFSPPSGREEDFQHHLDWISHLRGLTPDEAAFRGDYAAHPTDGVSGPTAYADPATLPDHLRNMLGQLWHPDHIETALGFGVDPRYPHTLGIRGPIADALEEHDLPGHRVLRTDAMVMPHNSDWQIGVPHRNPLPVPALQTRDHLMFHALEASDAAVGLGLGDHYNNLWTSFLLGPSSTPALPWPTNEQQRHARLTGMAAPGGHSADVPIHTVGPTLADWMRGALDWSHQYDQNFAQVMGQPAPEQDEAQYQHFLQILERLRHANFRQPDLNWISSGTYADDSEPTQYGWSGGPADLAEMVRQGTLTPQNPFSQGDYLKAILSARLNGGRMPLTRAYADWLEANGKPAHGYLTRAAAQSNAVVPLPWHLGGRHASPHDDYLWSGDWERELFGTQLESNPHSSEISLTHDLGGTSGFGTGSKFRGLGTWASIDRAIHPELLRDLEAEGARKTGMMSGSPGRGLRALEPGWFMSPMHPEPDPADALAEYLAQLRQQDEQQGYSGYAADGEPLYYTGPHEPFHPTKNPGGFSVHAPGSSIMGWLDPHSNSLRTTWPPEWAQTAGRSTPERDDTTRAMSDWAGSEPVDVFHLLPSPQDEHGISRWVPTNQGTQRRMPEWVARHLFEPQLETTASPFWSWLAGPPKPHWSDHELNRLMFSPLTPTELFRSGQVDAPPAAMGAVHDPDDWHSRMVFADWLDDHQIPWPMVNRHGRPELHEDGGYYLDRDHGDHTAGDEERRIAQLVRARLGNKLSLPVVAPPAPTDPNNRAAQQAAQKRFWGYADEDDPTNYAEPNWDLPNSGLPREVADLIWQLWQPQHAAEVSGFGNPSHGIRGYLADALQEHGLRGWKTLSTPGAMVVPWHGEQAVRPGWEPTHWTLPVPATHGTGDISIMFQNLLGVSDPFREVRLGRMHPSTIWDDGKHVDMHMWFREGGPYGHNPITMGDLPWIRDVPRHEVGGHLFDAANEMLTPRPEYTKAFDEYLNRLPQLRGLQPDRDAVQRGDYAFDQGPTQYMDPLTTPDHVQQLMTTLWSPELRPHRFGLDNPLYGPRGHLADALEELGIPGFNALRTPGTPITLGDEPWRPVPGVAGIGHLRGLRDEAVRRLLTWGMLGARTPEGVAPTLFPLGPLGHFNQVHPRARIGVDADFGPEHPEESPNYEYHQVPEMLAHWLTLWNQDQPKELHGPRDNILNNLRNADPFFPDHEWISRGDYAAYSDDEPPTYYAFDQGPTQYGTEDELMAAIRHNPLELTTHGALADFLSDQGRHEDETFRRSVLDGLRERLYRPEPYTPPHWNSPETNFALRLPITNPEEWGYVSTYRPPPDDDWMREMGPRRKSRGPFASAADFGWNGFSWIESPERPAIAPFTDPLPDSVNLTWQQLMTARHAGEWPGFPAGHYPEQLSPAEEWFAGLRHAHNLEHVSWPLVEEIMKWQHNVGRPLGVRSFKGASEEERSRHGLMPLMVRDYADDAVPTPYVGDTWTLGHWAQSQLDAAKEWAGQKAQSAADAFGISRVQQRKIAGVQPRIGNSYHPSWGFDSNDDSSGLSGVEGWLGQGRKGTPAAVPLWDRAPQFDVHGNPMDWIEDPMAAVTDPDRNDPDDIFNAPSRAPQPRGPVNPTKPGQRPVAPQAPAQESPLPGWLGAGMEPPLWDRVPHVPVDEASQGFGFPAEAAGRTRAPAPQNVLGVPSSGTPGNWDESAQDRGPSGDDQQEYQQLFQHWQSAQTPEERWHLANEIGNLLEDSGAHSDVVGYWDQMRQNHEQGHMYAADGFPTQYANGLPPLPRDVMDLIHALWAKDQRPHRFGAGDPLHGPRGYLADALDDHGLPGGVALRTPGVPIGQHWHAAEQGGLHLPAPGLAQYFTGHLRTVREYYRDLLDQQFEPPLHSFADERRLPNVAIGSYPHWLSEADPITPSSQVLLWPPHGDFDDQVNVPVHDFSDKLADIWEQHLRAHLGDVLPEHQRVFNLLRQQDPFPADQDWIERGDYSAYQGDEPLTYGIYVPQHPIDTLPNDVQTMIQLLMSPAHRDTRLGRGNPLNTVRGPLADAFQDLEVPGFNALRESARPITTWAGNLVPGVASVDKARKLRDQAGSFLSDHLLWQVSSPFITRGEVPHHSRLYLSNPDETDEGYSNLYNFHSNLAEMLRAGAHQLPGSIYDTPFPMKELHDFLNAPYHPLPVDPDHEWIGKGDYARYSDVADDYPQHGQGSYLPEGFDPNFEIRALPGFSAGMPHAITQHPDYQQREQAYSTARRPIDRQDHAGEMVTWLAENNAPWHLIYHWARTRARDAVDARESQFSAYEGDEPTQYAFPLQPDQYPPDVVNMLHQLFTPAYSAHRHGHDDPQQGLRGILADAFDDHDIGGSSWLREAGLPITLHPGTGRPTPSLNELRQGARNSFRVTRDMYVPGYGIAPAEYDPRLLRGLQNQLGAHLNRWMREAALPHVGDFHPILGLSSGPNLLRTNLWHSGDLAAIGEYPRYGPQITSTDFAPFEFPGLLGDHVKQHLTHPDTPDWLRPLLDDRAFDLLPHATVTRPDVSRWNQDVDGFHTTGEQYAAYEGDEPTQYAPPNITHPDVAALNRQTIVNPWEWSTHLGLADLHDDLGDHEEATFRRNLAQWISERAYNEPRRTSHGPSLATAPRASVPEWAAAKLPLVNWTNDFLQPEHAAQFGMGFDQPSPNMLPILMTGWGNPYGSEVGWRGAGPSRVENMIEGLRHAHGMTHAPGEEPVDFVDPHLEALIHQAVQQGDYQAAQNYRNLYEHMRATRQTERRNQYF